MKEKNKNTLTKAMAKFVTGLAAETAAEVAIEAYKNEKKKDAESSHDRRFQNTKLLLKNYRNFVEYRGNAVYETMQVMDRSQVIYEIMSNSPVDNYTVESIKKNVAITHTMLEHIDEMLEVYKKRCNRSPKAEVRRRWRVVESRYLSESEKTEEEIAEIEFVSVRTVQYDLEKAYDELSELFFGIDFNNMLQ